MKKKFLLFSFLLACVGSGAKADEVTFDFSTPADLGKFTYAPLSISELIKSTYLNNKGVEKDRCYISGGSSYVLILEGETISKDGVSLFLDNPEKVTNYPRYFFGPIDKFPETDPKAEDFYSDIRWYTKETLQVSVDETKKIDKVVLCASYEGLKNRDNSETIIQTEGGVQTFSDDKTLNTWIADQGTQVSEILYKAIGSSTQMAYTITVTYSDKENGSGISSVNSNDDNAPVEYYDLTGVRCNPDNLTPGIYVMRKGASVKKVAIK